MNDDPTQPGDPTVEPILVSREKAAELLGVSPSSFDRHVSHELTPLRIGSRLLFDVAEIRAWVAKKSGRDRPEECAPDDRRARTIRNLSPRAQEILANLRREPGTPRKRSTR